jgi:hypothetical protein
MPSIFRHAAGDLGIEPSADKLSGDAELLPLRPFDQRRGLREASLRQGSGAFIGSATTGILNDTATSNTLNSGSGPKLAIATIMDNQDQRAVKNGTLLRGVVERRATGHQLGQLHQHRQQRQRDAERR